MKKNKGILFWITGLSGSGKTSLAKKIYPTIKKKYGPTILLDGDRLRKILKLNGYSYKERLSNTKIYNQIVKFITDQNINVIISLVGLMHIPRNWNRKNIKRYIEIFIKSEVKKIILKDKKKVYKNNKDVVGLNIKPQFPKAPDIIINNTFEKNLDYLTLELLNKISIFINKK
jgi:adenylylsulfate kinase-like enzyme